MFKTVYCVNDNCSILRGYFDTGGYQTFQSHGEDPIYTNLRVYCKVPAYVNPRLFYCDPRKISFGSILSKSDFIERCDPNTGDITISRPSIPLDAIAAYRRSIDNFLIVYSESLVKHDLDPDVDGATISLLESRSKWLFGGKILTEYEANLYEINQRYFGPTLGETPIDDVSTTINVDISVPFIRPDESFPEVFNESFVEFIQINRKVIETIYRSFTEPPKEIPLLTLGKTVKEKWDSFISAIAIEDFRVNQKLKDRE